MSILKKGSTSTYREIERYSEDNNLNVFDLGKFLVGESFIVVKSNSKDLTAGFVLTGTAGDNSIYECIYSDF